MIISGKLRIYLDNCCFNRPYDIQTLDTVRLESQAKLAIQDRVREGKIELVWSFILDMENKNNPYDDRKSIIREWKNIAVVCIGPGGGVRDNAESIVKDFKLKAKDALHPPVSG